jgi:hypothetical protein
MASEMLVALETAIVEISPPVGVAFDMIEHLQ